MRLPALLSAVLLLAAAPAFAETKTYTLDSTHAHVQYSVDHLGFSTSRGAFRDVSGTLQLDVAKPETAKLNVTIPIAGFDSFDKKRDEHIKSADFLDAAKYPDMTFTSTKVQKTGPKTAKVTGDLTLHGVTKPVVLNVTLHKQGEHPVLKKAWAGFSATGTIKRSDFGISAGIPFVSDAVQITLDAEFAGQ
ncbi:YceI family protein [Roseiterribacter gracilis]|uniref:Polyisoprenoid-binding protein n=1 Tax=Roseiterribacter gracilis TaxID=2812848 RepID=A0A8S8XH65_9PROT|nr:polyisoprenoid-binding protein [Rhodospirillales bacterium TMPK1]